MLLTLIIIPILGIIKIMSSEKEKIKEWGLITSIITYIYSMYIWILFDNNEYNFQMYAYKLGIDGISINLIILTTILTVLIIISGPYEKDYIIWILLTESILIGVFSVLDIIYFYILFELILIPLYYIIKKSKKMYEYRKNKIQRAINKLFGYTLFGSFIMLIGMILLYKEIGNTNYNYIINKVGEIEEEGGIWIKTIWITFFIAFGVKVPIMPLHVWLPEAHSEAPTGGSMILAGILLKLGTYGIIRYLIPIFPKTTIYYRPYIEVIIIISIVYSAITIIRQVEIKKFIAYSSISHMNLCLLGIFSGELDSILGAYYIMINHGIISAGLFFCAGILFNRYSLRAIKYYRGLLVSMPIFSIFFIILNLANIGFPPFGSFISEILIFMGSFKHSFWSSIWASISIILGGVYGIWFITRIIYGRPKSNQIKKNELINLSNDLTKKEFFILLVLLGISILLGLYPSFLLDSLYLSISTLLI